MNKKQMGKHKAYSYTQGVFLSVFFDKQLLQGTFVIKSSCCKLSRQVNWAS